MLSMENEGLEMMYQTAVPEIGSVHFPALPVPVLHFQYPIQVHFI